MKTYVIYESLFGNTAEIARAVARGLGDVSIRDVRETGAAEVVDSELLVLGGPTHAFSMSRPSTRRDAHQQGAPVGDDGRGLRDLLTELPEDMRVPVAVFDTRVAKVRKLPGSAAKAAAHELVRHHHATVVDRESFYVDDTEGPLIGGELDRAFAWGVRLRAKSTRETRLPPHQDPLSPAQTGRFTR